METNGDEATFTFSWLALRLLGRGLYSNPWSALSELVANGLDAGATNVHVYVDARNKSAAVVEVIDDGTGMSRHDIDTYVKVGHNKRAEARANNSLDPNPKGRKGIGKLAALFLSRHFFLQTKHADGATSWELDATAENVSDSDTPSLKSVSTSPFTLNDALWSRQQTGTRLTMLNVDLAGYGPQSINALGSRLANQFLIAEDGGPQILLAVRTGEDDPLEYSRVEKSIAFKNFAEVAQSFSDHAVQPQELAEPPTSVRIPAKGMIGGVYLHTPVRSAFPTDAPTDEAWAEISADVDLSNRTYKGIRFALTGWIGAHATIETDAAKDNDPRFVRNRFYNPAQIRVYVRGKLASDRLLTQLGLTGTYANYIEGEVTFDLLDDDELEDIATSNRQDFDETDGRVTLLRALVRPVVRSLIQKRNRLAGEIKALEASETDRRNTVSKRNFSDQVRADLAQHPEISESTRDQLQMVITNKVQGELPLKDKYLVFISHARSDRTFASFIDEILRSRGARKDEIFFTSRSGSTTVALDDRSLGSLIKENIVDANTLIFYMTSKNFLKSEFCLFEGGAGWATRSVNGYLKLNMDYESIPKFLTNGKSETTLISADKIELTPELHNYLIEGILNPMIDHLNQGRELSADSLIERFVLETAPSAVEMHRAGTNPSHYFDADIVEHWEVLVNTEASDYLSSYLEN